jgi:hypothetical protein
MGDEDENDYFFLFSVDGECVSMKRELLSMVGGGQ